MFYSFASEEEPHDPTIFASDSVSVMDDMKMGDRVFIKDQPHLYSSKALTWT